MRILFAAAALMITAAPDRGAEVTGQQRAHFVFTAVLQACLDDDLPRGTVENILKQEKNEYVNFVPKCPICMPVIDAFRAYLAVEMKWIYKAKEDAPEGLLEQLKSDPAETLQAGLKRYVERAVQKRYRAARFTETEVNDMEQALRFGLKEGMAGINLRPQMKDCPSCRGASELFKK